MDTDVEDFAGKKVVIIGGETGIGCAVSRKFAAAGAEVVIGGILSPEGEALAAELSANANVRFVKTDVRIREEVDAVIQTPSGPLDILVYCAGIFDGFLSARETTDEIFDQVMNINLRGAFWANRAALDVMVPRGYGKIVNIGSIASFTANADGFAYTVSKHALHAVTKHIAYRYSEFGICANTVCPGIIETKITSNSARIWGENAPKMDVIDNSDGWKRLVPARRKGLPAEVADLVLFLADNRSSYISGQAHVIDGGWLTA
jgi:NAD(P)-dependent dehydrogenase (short-subunit alcohol dehydrogenase family)